MTPDERERFDALVTRVLESLPEGVRAMVDEVAVVIEDEPDADVLRELGMPPEDGTALCGLHTGVSRVDVGIEDAPIVPSVVHLFRHGIVELAGGAQALEAEVLEEIRITLLHELGHEMGLDEDDLDELGYS